MMFNVPQFIDVEDKVAGPLTAKQLFWMIGMFATILVVATLFPGPATYVIAVPIVIVFVLFAFYRPGGQPLLSYAVHGFFFLFRPKVLEWSRPKPQYVAPAVKRERQASAPRSRNVSIEDIRRIAEAADKR